VSDHVPLRPVAPTVSVRLRARCSPLSNLALAALLFLAGCGVPVQGHEQSTVPIAVSRRAAEEVDREAPPVDEEKRGTLSPETPPGALPPGCLLAGSLTDAEGLLALAGEQLSDLDPALGPEELRRRLGRFIGNPSLAGVDLSKPLRFCCLDPRLAEHPWALELAVTDMTALREEVAANGSSGLPWRIIPRVGRAVLSHDPRAASMLEVLAGHAPDPVAPAMPGRFHLRVNLPLLMDAYQPRMAAQLELMKERMRESAARVRTPEAELRRATQELETFFALLHEVELLDVAADITSDSAVLRVRAHPAPGTAIASLAAAQPRAPARLLRRCPADAYAIGWTNFSFAAVLRRHLMRLLRPVVGAPSEATTAEENADGETLVGLFPASGGSGIELVEIRTGPRALQLAQRWERWSAPAGTTASPVRLTAVPGPDALPDDASVARLALDPDASGELGTNLLRRAFGPEPMAMLHQANDRAVLIIAADPLRRHTVLEEAYAGTAPALGSDPAFLRSFEGLDGTPNLLCYVSPAGIGQWLKLAKIDMTLSPATAMGIAFAASVRPGGDIVGEIRLPTETFRRALGSARSAKPAP